MRKFIFTLLLFILTIIVILPIASVQAQTSWECVFDFTTGNGGWQGGIRNPLFNATYIASTGWRHTNTDTNSYLDISFELWRSFPVGIVVNSLSYSYNLSASPGAAVNETNFLSNTQTGAANPQILSSDTPLSVGTNSVTLIGSPSATIHNGISVGFLTYFLPNTTITFTITNLTMSGTGTLPDATYCTETTTTDYVRPLQSSDVDAWGIIANLNNNSADTDKAVFAYSTSAGLPVFAAVDGTITQREWLLKSDCSANIGGVGTFLGGTFDCSFVGGDNDYYYLEGATGSGDNTGVWLVRLYSSTLDTEFVYFVDKADQYVNEGATISAGCVLGETMLIENASSGEFATQGLATVAVKQSGAIIASLASFTIEPDSELACNINTENANCMGDVQLNDPFAWTTNNATYQNPGFRLQPGGYIRQTMNLDAAREPEVIVKIRAPFGTGDGEFAITIGQTTETFFVATNNIQFETFTLNAGPHAPDGQFYTIRITNNGTSVLDIASVCVRFTKQSNGDPQDNPDPPQQTCVFNNYSFNDGSAGWTLSGSVETATGEMRVPTTHTLTQNITATAGDYTLIVVASIWHYSSYTPDDQSTDDVLLEYDFPVDSTYTPIQTVTFGQFADQNNIVSFEVPVTLASDTTGDFTLRAIIDSVSGVRGVTIRSVCLDDGSGGGGGGGGGNDGDDLFDEECDAIARPSGTEQISVWFVWHWRMFNRFFQCQLMILLNEMYNLASDAWYTTSFSIRWSQESTRLGVDWFTEDFTGWLGGHLNNIALGQVTNIYSEDQCNNIFCLIGGLGNNLTDIIQSILDAIVPLLQQIVDVLLSILNQTAGVLLAAAVAALQIVISLMAKMFELLNMAQNLLYAIISAWTNATPITVPGLINCTATQEGYCGGIWVIDNTIFGDASPAAGLIPILVGVWSIRLIIWVANELRSTLIAIGAST